MLAALWDLVWSGHVTNDGLAPLRAQLGRGRTARRTTARPRPGGLRRIGPPAGAGRWSLVRTGAERRHAHRPRPRARARSCSNATASSPARARGAEGIVGGYAAVYPVLRALEESGKVRRGYFVAGLGAAQFALPGAVDRLRTHRNPDPDAEPRVLAATDPAQPYGAALPWPERPEGGGRTGRPSRAAGAYVVLHDGALVAYLERGARTLATFTAEPDWCGALLTLVKDGRLRQIELTHVDGQPVREHPHAEAWRAAGARGHPRGLVVRG